MTPGTTTHAGARHPHTGAAGAGTSHSNDAVAGR